MAVWCSPLVLRTDTCTSPEMYRIYTSWSADHKSRDWCTWSVCTGSCSRLHLTADSQMAANSEKNKFPLTSARTAIGQRGGRTSVEMFSIKLSFSIYEFQKVRLCFSQHWLQGQEQDMQKEVADESFCQLVFGLQGDTDAPVREKKCSGQWRSWTCDT